MNEITYGVFSNLKLLKNVSISLRKFFKISYDKATKSCKKILSNLEVFYGISLIKFYEI